MKKRSKSFGFRKILNCSEMFNWKKKIKQNSAIWLYSPVIKRLSKHVIAMKLDKIKVHIALSSPSVLHKPLNLMDIIHFSPKFTNCL